jgi:hypothetical protein
MLQSLFWITIIKLPSLEHADVCKVYVIDDDGQNVLLYLDPANLAKGFGNGKSDPTGSKNFMSLAKKQTLADKLEPDPYIPRSIWY